MCTAGNHDLGVALACCRRWSSAWIRADSLVAASRASSAACDDFGPVLLASAGDLVVVSGDDHASTLSASIACRIVWTTSGTPATVNDVFPRNALGPAAGRDDDEDALAQLLLTACSTASQRMWQIAMWASWMRGVLADGTARTSRTRLQAGLGPLRSARW